MSDRARAYLVLVLMPMFFSTNIVIGRAAVATVEPWTLAFWRWVLASLILLPFAWRGIRLHRAALLEQWRLIALLGFLGMVVCGGGVYLSLTSTTATNGTLIYTSSPVFVLLLEAIFRGQKIVLRQVVGIVLAVLGVAMIVLRGELARLLALELNIGDLGIALAAFAWAVYSVILKRPVFRTLPTVPLFFAISSAGALMLLPFMAYELVGTGRLPTSAAAWTSILGLAVLSSVLPFLAYQYGVKIVGPSITSVFLYFLPVYGVSFAAIFLGESFHAYHAAGFILVMAGVVLATAPLDAIRARRTSTAG